MSLLLSWFKLTSTPRSLTEQGRWICSASYQVLLAHTTSRSCCPLFWSNAAKGHSPQGVERCDISVAWVWANGALGWAKLFLGGFKSGRSAPHWVPCRMCPRLGSADEQSHWLGSLLGHCMFEFAGYYCKPLLTYSSQISSGWPCTFPRNPSSVRSD